METSNRSKKRGSILVVTIVLATGVALSLGSFIALAVQSVKLSNRSFHLNSALNLAEAGVEEGVYSVNNNDWSGWLTHVSGASNKVRTISSLNLGQGATGEIKIVVYGATTSPTPRIVAQGTAAPSIGPAIVKQIEVNLKRRSHWASGLVARDKIVFSGGNATVDSYKSNDPNYSTSGYYDASKRRDKGSAGSTSVTTDAVSISNSDIWGFVATGGAPPQVGPHGTIRGVTTPHGVNVDPTRIATDFTANFEPVAPPSSFDAVYPNISGDATLGSSGTTTTIKTANISNHSSETLHITGHVSLTVSNEIDIKGALVVWPHSSLTLYIGGDASIGGNGAVNMSGIPANLIIYGTATTIGGQEIKLHGNGALQAAVYAPNASLELKGGGSSGVMSGSAVAHTVKVTGNYAFHYDEALSEEGGSNPFAVSKWRELMTGTDRVSL